MKFKHGGYKMLIPVFSTKVQSKMVATFCSYPGTLWGIFELLDLNRAELHLIFWSSRLLWLPFNCVHQKGRRKWTRQGPKGQNHAFQHCRTPLLLLPSLEHWVKQELSAVSG
jgi:hypothetical protein